MQLDIRSEVDAQGFAFLPSYEPTSSSLEASSSIGSPVNLIGYPAAQTLKPRAKDPERMNSYSGVFGMRKFPLHTDLAHWSTPPRYIVLRCISGASSTGTTLYDGNNIKAIVGESQLSRLLITPRRRLNQVQPLLRVFSKKAGIPLMRWDALFTVPAADEYQNLFDSVLSLTNQASVETIVLAQPADTLVIDNWRMLHGRTAVHESDESRRIERTYLKEIG